MRLDVYQTECERIANEQSALLNEARQRIISDKPLNKLEQSGVLHALQVLIENAIGKAKHRLKALGVVVPVSAYDVFAALELQGYLENRTLKQWNSAIGIRNRIVHDYMNIDMQLIESIIVDSRYRFIVEFLREPIS
ncbi:MAG TPA: DUF86 domain-containing protein [Methylococcaceae bacterium]|nr:DUF86 domain-containing protein [Methylococcaceae bacterium]